MDQKNALAVYSNVSDPLTFVGEVGRQIAHSKMLGCANEAQGQVIAMTCMCEGISPIEFSRKYHIIGNKPSMRADAMLAEFRSRGGKHKVLERTSDAAAVELSFGGQTYTERLSWADAQQEPFVFGQHGQIKDNWSTPRARRQMLWARVISEGVRTLCPEIVAGTYTPEEVADEQAEVATAVNVEQLVVENGRAATVKECTPQQRQWIRELFDQLMLTDEQVAGILEKRGVASLRHLSHEQADELAKALEVKVNQLAEKMAGESRLPEAATSADVAAPAEQSLVDQIKAKLKDDFEAIKIVKDYLTRKGMAKLADLSHEDAEALLSALTNNALHQFFADNLAAGEDSPF